MVGLAVAYLRTPRAAEDACQLARRELPSLIGMDVGIGSCELDPVTQTVKLRGVSLFEPGAEVPLLAADEAEVTLGAVRPFFGSVALDSVKLLRPRVRLDLSKPKPSKPAGGCSLDALNRIELGRVEVRNAEIRVVLPGGRAVEVLNADLTVRRRRGRSEIRLQSGRGNFQPRPGEELELSALMIDGRFDPEEQSLEVTRAELGIDGMSLSGSGDITHLCEPEFSLEANAFVPMTTVAHALGWQSQVAGHLWSHVDIEGSGAQPNIGIELSGTDLAIGHYHPGAFDARLRLHDRELQVEQLEIPVGGGRVRAKGSIGLSAKIPLAFEADIEGAELGPALAKAGLPGAWVNFPSSGKGRVAGNLLPSLALEGDVDLKTGQFVLASRAYDAPPTTGKVILEFEHGAAKAVFQVFPDRFQFVNMRAEGPSSAINGTATLYFAKEKGLEISGTAERLTFDDFGHIAGIHWAGTGTGSFEIKGPYSDVHASAVVSLRDFDMWKLSLGVLQGRLEYANKVLAFPSASGQKGRTQYFGDGTLTFGEGPLVSKGAVHLGEGRLEDLVDVLMPMHENVALFQGPLEGDVSGSFTVDCPSNAFAAVADLQLRNTRYYERRVGDGHLVLRFVDGQEAILDRTVLRGPLGVTEVDGTWNFDGPLDYRFKLRASLAELFGAERAERMNLSGDLTLVGTVGGDTTVYTVNAWATAPSIVFAGKNLGSTHLEGRIVGREMQVWGRAFNGAQANLKMRLKTPYPWTLTGTLSLPEIRPLLPEGAISQGVSGSIAGSVDAVGNLKDGSALEGTARIDRFTLTRGDFAGANDGRIDLIYKSGRLTVENFVFRGPNTQLTMGGTAGPSALDLSLHGALDMRLLESFVPRLERTSGKVEVTAAAGGTLERPTLAGSAVISDARLSLRDQPVSLRGLSGRVDFSDQRLIVQDVHGVLNEGRVALDGDVRMEAFQPKMLELRAQLDEITLRPTDDLPITTTGELHLAGRPDALTLSGDLDLVRFRYDQPLVLESLLTDIRKARVAPAGDGPREAFLDFDLAVHANGDVQIDNNLAKAKLRGDLRLTGNNLHPGLLGSIEAIEGGQIYFRGNTFSVNQALVEFKDRREIDPVFDLHAQTQVREYLVTLHGFGRIKDPQIILSSDPDLPEPDILSLLTIGVTSRDQANSATTGVGMALGEALFNASGLDKQVQRFLPKNPILRDLSFHISSTYNSTSGYVEPTAQLESKFLTDKLQLELSQPVVSGKGTRAQAEYRFDDRLAGQLQWDNERNENLPNFGVDLKLHWEVE